MVSGDVNEVCLSIDGGNMWVCVIQGMVGIWDYIWLKDVIDGLYILMVEVIDKVGNKMMQMFDFIIDIWLLMFIIVMDSRDDIGVIGDYIMSVKRLGFIIGNIDVDVYLVILWIIQGGNSQEVILIQVGGQWCFMLDVDWVDGSYMLMVEVMDNVGNVCQFMLLVVMVDM